MSFFSFFLISFLFLFWRSHPGPGKAGKVGPEPGRAWHGNREILLFQKIKLVETWKNQPTVDREFFQGILVEKQNMPVTDAYSILEGGQVKRG